MILCATDFSPNAEVATTIAARMANRTGLPLHVVHVIDSGAMSVDLDEAQLDRVRERLTREADRLRRHCPTVAEQLVQGAPDERIVELAEQLRPRAVVIGAFGFRSPRRWLIGSIAERVVQTSDVPVLAVRAREQIDAWTRGETQLRVLICHDGTGGDDALLGWTSFLRQIGPCELMIGHICFPPPARSPVHAEVTEELRNDDDAAHVLGADLTARWRRIGEGPSPTVRVELGLGMAAHQIAELVEREHADLVVVGTHRRQGLDRFWHGSISQGVLRLAGVTVACIPRT